MLFGMGLNQVMSLSILASVLEVFTQISTWLIGALQNVVDLFWSNGELTFYGVLAVAALGISVFFLLVRIVQNFLHFRS